MFLGLINTCLVFLVKLSSLLQLILVVCIVAAGQISTVFVGLIFKQINVVYVSILNLKALQSFWINQQLSCLLILQTKSHLNLLLQRVIHSLILRLSCGTMAATTNPLQGSSCHSRAPARQTFFAIRCRPITHLQRTPSSTTSC